MRVPQPSESRGSLQWIRRLVARRPDLLEGELRQAGALDPDATVDWRSPRDADEWAEYRDGDFLDLLGQSALRPALQEFWPRGGPQWDALGCAGDGTVFLVEAKAHLGELKSSCAATAPDALARIKASLNWAREVLGAAGNGDWLTGYYQYANRLAHLAFLRSNGLPAWLVFLYFVGETGMPGAPVSRAQWGRERGVVYRHLGLDEANRIPGVVDIYLDVAELANAAPIGDEPEAVQRYPAGYEYAARFPVLSRVFGAEGGSVYSADGPEGFAVITDESALVDLLDEELDCVTVRHFSTREARDAYVARLRERLGR